jgi:hypothetical protein
MRRVALAASFPPLLRTDVAMPRMPRARRATAQRFE